jgi:3-methyladenine DNA glycosylase AlkC
MPFADELIGPQVASQLARSIQDALPDRPLRHLPGTVGALEGLSVRERADLLRDALLADVPGDYATLATAVRRACGEAPEFRGWLIWPVTSALAVRALDEDTVGSFTDAMGMLAELTERLSSEFALRILLRHDHHRALGLIQGWTASGNEHVRRLASEGTRPYLPWAVRVPEIIARPGITLPLLDALYRDESEYVRRSVANHLNDLSRDAPDLVVGTARRWLDDPEPTTPAVVRHGLRTLIKRGNPEALAVLGFAPASVDVDGPHLGAAQVPWGGTVRFTAVVSNTGMEPARLAIDYVVHHRKANGSLSAKVFKLATCTLDPGKQFAVDRTHSFRPITTRRYHPGGHAIALQVNGVPTPIAPFDLLPEAPTSVG